MNSHEAQAELLARMRDVIARRGNHIAVWEHDFKCSYSRFGELIDGFQISLGERGNDQPVGLLLDRSAFAYAAMWAAISCGRGYVPLNPRYPQGRLRNIIEQAGVIEVVCDETTQGLANELGIQPTNQVLPPSREVSASEGTRKRWWEPVPGGKIAYVLFTSGSTGTPKGVPISYGNLLAFIDNVNVAIPYVEDDICSQVCELSFDVSVEEVYLALLNGCTLCPARQVDLFNPAHFIASRSISVWIGVPSLARVVLNNGIPVGDHLQSIRLSIFNGETLTADLARAWRDAARNSQIWNTYGPTECTVAVTTQPWSDEPWLEESGGVAIGTPFPDCRTALIVNDEILRTSEAPAGSSGELLLATPQRFIGYSDSKIASPFVTGDDGTTYYRTGDRVLWRDCRLYFLGRIDLQVKVGGHRIELLEIEHQLRNFLRTDSLAVVAHPAQHPTELVLFVAGISSEPLLEGEALHLPTYMLPKRTVVMDKLPLNAHGKLDRSTLQTLAGNRA